MNDDKNTEFFYVPRLAAKIYSNAFGLCGGRFRTTIKKYFFIKYNYELSKKKRFFVLLWRLPFGWSVWVPSNHKVTYIYTFIVL